jgi:hypothetical protein
MLIFFIAFFSPLITPITFIIFADFRQPPLSRFISYFRHDDYYHVFSPLSPFFTPPLWLGAQRWLLRFHYFAAFDVSMPPYFIFDAFASATLSAFRLIFRPLFRFDAAARHLRHY